jgi:hypothetical protein
LKHTCALLLTLVVLCFSPSLLSQSTNATISGMVLDQSGKAIPDADLIILNEATAVQYPSKTNNVGIYTISILPPGQYRLEVSKTGFKTVIKPDVVLNVQSAISLNFTLPVGAASESITVDAGSSLVNTVDASVSTVVDQKFVENMPLNGRSFQDLISMTPGVVTQSPQASSSIGFRGDFSINGQRTESNYYTIDGVSGNVSAGNGQGTAQAAAGGAISASTALGTTQSLLSVDALQEFRVESSTYAAEFGRSPGGQLVFLTRSGTKTLHGSAFDYLRNNFFDANDWFNDHNDVPPTALRQNDFGGTLGGPVWIPGLSSARQALFFFFSYEGLRLTQPQAASTQFVPDNYLRSAAPIALQPFLNAFPQPTHGPQDQDFGSQSSPNLATFIKPYSLPSSIDSTSIRVDHALNQKLALFFRYAYAPSGSTTRTLSTVTNTIVDTTTYTFGATSQLRDNFANEFRVGFATSKSAIQRGLDSFGGAQTLDLASAIGFDSSAGSTPAATVQLSFAGIGTTNIQIANRQNHADQWNVTDAVSLTTGKHSLKFGIDYRHYTAPLNPPSLFANTGFNNVQAVLSNKTSTLNLQRYLSSTPVMNEIAAYAQDQWKLSTGLTLSLGVRWEADPPPTEANGNDAYTVLGNIGSPATLTLAPRGTRLWKTSWYNFAPRLGVAWIAHPDPQWQTVIRAGGGAFFDSLDQIATNGFESVGFYALKSYANSPLPVTDAQTDFAVSVTPPYSAPIYAFPSHLQLPYTLQWNTSLEQSFGKAQSLSLSYVGANGRRLPATQQMSISAFNPNIGTLLYLAPGITSNFQSLQLKFQRTLTHGINVLTSYTWAHNIDFGSNAAALSQVRGNSDYDVRHNLQGGVSWEIPRVIGHSRIVQVLSDEWGFDGRVLIRSAFPVTLSGNLITDPSTGIQYYGNVNLIEGQPIYLYNSAFPGRREVNKGAFVAASSGTGTAPRNFVRAFGESQLNTAIRRSFPLSQRISLNFRVEAFNILNHPNFGYVDPTLTDITFGQATKMLNASLGTVSSLYQQGGPRSMQFALSLHF